MILFVKGYIFSLKSSFIWRFKKVYYLRPKYGRILFLFCQKIFLYCMFCAPAASFIHICASLRSVFLSLGTKFPMIEKTDLCEHIRMVCSLLIMHIQNFYRFVYPIKDRSTAFAASLPSRIAHTTRDCPLCMSPAVKTFGTEV